MARSATKIGFEFNGTKEEDHAARNIIKGLLKDVTDFEYDVDSCTLLEDLPLEWDAADDFGYTASSALIKAFPNNPFKVMVHFCWLCTEGEFTKSYEYDGNTLHFKGYQNPYDFDGTCPECGHEIIEDIWSWTYEEGKTYICDECGEEVEFDNPELEYSEYETSKEEVLSSMD